MFVIVDLMTKKTTIKNTNALVEIKVIFFRATSATKNERTVIAKRMEPSDLKMIIGK